MLPVDAASPVLDDDPGLVIFTVGAVVLASVDTATDEDTEVDFSVKGHVSVDRAVVDALAEDVELSEDEGWVDGALDVGV